MTVPNDGAQNVPEPQDTQTLQEIDDLEGLTTESVEKLEETKTVKIGEDEVPLEEVIEAYQNKGNWQKSNTQKAQEIAEQKRQLEERDRQLRDAEANLNMFERGIYQRYQPTQEPPKEDFNIDEELDDPALKAMYKKLSLVEQTLQQQRKQAEEEKFIEGVQREHARLKGLFGDNYDPITVERSVVQGRNQFEDAFKAMRFDRISTGDKEAIKSLISDELMTDIKTEIRKQLIEDIRKKENARKALATPRPEKTAPLKLPEKPVKDYQSAVESALEELQSSGQSLIT